MGILTGVGQQRLAAVINAIGYYVIGIPFMYILAFNFELGVLGIWLAILLGNFVALTLLLISFHRIEWEGVIMKESID